MLFMSEREDVEIQCTTPARPTLTVNRQADRAEIKKDFNKGYFDEMKVPDLFLLSSHQRQWAHTTVPAPTSLSLTLRLGTSRKPNLSP